MRPTLTEFVANMRRILQEAVAPEVHAPYAAHMLRGVIANLEVIESSWDGVLPFFAWDNEQTFALLVRAGAELGQQLVPADATPDGARPFDAAFARNLALRERLAEAVARLDPSGEAAAAVREHLTERSRRYPLTWRWVPPATD